MISITDTLTGDVDCFDNIVEALRAFGRANHACRQSKRFAIEFH